MIVAIVAAFDKTKMINIRQAKVYFCICQILCTLRLAASKTGMGSLSMEAQQELLNAHNFFRGIVAPPTSNMEKMVSIVTNLYQSSNGKPKKL